MTFQVVEERGAHDAFLRLLKDLLAASMRSVHVIALCMVRRSFPVHAEYMTSKFLRPFHMIHLMQLVQDSMCAGNVSCTKDAVLSCCWLRV